VAIVSWRFALSALFVNCRAGRRVLSSGTIIDPEEWAMLHVRSCAITLAAAAGALLLAMPPAVAAGGWSIVPAPPTGQNGELAGTSAVSDTDAWAVGTTAGETNGVGAKPLIDNWNGSAWKQVTAPATPGNTAYLRRVSASGPSDAWAVGDTSVNRSDFAPLALHWNGTTWANSPSAAAVLPPSTTLYGVADISPTDAYAIGDNSSLASGEAEHWNGTTWSALTLPLPTSTGFPTTLNAISASGPDNVWIVGTYMVQVSSTNLRYETYSLHFNGTSWSIAPMPLVSGSDSALVYVINSIVANSPTDVWAVGGSGDNIPGQGGTTSNTLTEHWNGTAWTVVPSPTTGTFDNLNGVTTSNAANDVWAVGSYVPAGASSAQTLTLNWNGTAWTRVVSPDNGSPSVLFDTSATPGGGPVWAVGHSGSCCTENPLVLTTG
jgi:hypothetical protein